MGRIIPLLAALAWLGACGSDAPQQEAPEGPSRADSVEIAIETFDAAVFDTIAWESDQAALDRGGLVFRISCANSRPFLRGDATQDGALNMSDAAAIAKAVFGFGSKFPLIEKCMDSADVDDDGSVETTDAIYLLRYLFADGPPIAPPHTCDLDMTPSELPPCEAYACFVR